MNPTSLPDGAIVNANVRTMDPDRPTAEAVAWRQGRIVAVGTATDVLSHDIDGEILDAEGGTVTPGLIDSHTHPTWGAELSRGADLQGVHSFDQVLEVLRRQADVVRTRGEQWVFAWNLDYAALGDRQIRGEDLADSVYGMPAVVMFHDVHTAVATPAALAHARINGSEQFVDNSAVVCDAAGRPTGELREASAYNLLYDAAPPLTRNDHIAHVDRVLKEFASTGITGGVIMDGTLATLELLNEMEAVGTLPVRLDVALWHAPDRDDAGVSSLIEQLAAGGRRWKTGLIKLFLDGVIETGTAWLYEPDTCGDSDRSYWPDRQRFAEVVERYASAGFQIATHAIGDRAVGEVLDVYESVGVLAKNGAPHRIEHIETLTDGDLSRFQQLGIIASMQPLQMQWRHEDLSDRWSARLGPTRASRAYRTRDLIDSGVPLALGSDWPVVPFDPRIGMAWARLRRRPGDLSAQPFEPAQAIDAHEALHGYTAGAAQALGDHSRGIISEGRRADLTCFRGDPITASADELVELPILATYLDGECSYREEAR
ncbi:amidohydrolase [Rhodococcus sp. MSC1_016]|uniref:amidohydrolase n=1 Tax=Rhodococcus sp. MSC1_016 TaxID=2909266 RepID=UPI00202F21CA|nr:MULTISPECIES: amidohydrolase [Rhodococcus]